MSTTTRDVNVKICAKSRHQIGAFSYITRYVDSAIPRCVQGTYESALCRLAVTPDDLKASLFVSDMLQDNSLWYFYNVVTGGRAYVSQAESERRTYLTGS